MIMQATRTDRVERRETTAEETTRIGVPLESRRGRITTVPHHEEAIVERHEAIWLDGRVPNGYWDQPANRRRYMCWLGQRLGFHSRQDWYRITTEDFKRNGGGTVLQYWNDSAIRAVEDTYRDYDWKPWLFNFAPRHFWEDPANHQKYMQWLGEQLGIREPSDWYHVTNQDFKNHGGGGFLLQYNCTVSAAIKSYLPEFDWKEWMFDKTPKGFWQNRKNRQQYLMWLGAKLGYQTLDDWYAVTSDDFNANYGSQFLKRYGGLPLAALRDCLPRHTWHEWRFARVPAGFWGELDNCQRYVRWLGKKLKIESLRDWRRIRRRALLANFGGGLLTFYHSYWELLTKCVPGLKRETGQWDAEGLSQRGDVRRRQRSGGAETACSGKRRGDLSRKGHNPQKQPDSSRPGRSRATGD
jgi:hypothetical protein